MYSSARLSASSQLLIHLKIFPSADEDMYVEAGLFCGLYINIT